MKYLLLRGAVDEVNALLNVALQTLDSSFEQRLLLIGEVTQDVDGLLSTVGLGCVSECLCYVKFQRDVRQAQWEQRRTQRRSS